MKKNQRSPIERITPDPAVGLNTQQIAERKQKGYSNVSGKSLEKSTVRIIFDNTFTFFNCILFLIALLFFGFIVYLYAIGRPDVVDKHFGFSKFGFLIPALMNVIVGTFQELNSRRVIRQLKIVTEAKSKVIRNGTAETVEATDLVIDDVVLLHAGEQATADLTVLEGEVSVDESMLTGESDTVKKHAGDRVLSGSAIIVGDAKACVSEVGDDTYASKLSAKVKSGARHQSELMNSIVKIVRFLSIMLAVVTVTIIATLVYKISVHGNDPAIWDGMTLSLSDPVSWARIMVTVGSFGVGIIPAGLMLTTSVTLMISIAGLSKKQTLVQELYSLENLSRVDVICLDKTGTLTDGTMVVNDVKAFDHLEVVVEHIRNLMAATGSRNQTAEALYQKFGAAENAVYREAIPFSSATKCSGLVYENGDRLLMGAPEYLLEKDDERLAFVAEKAKEGKRVIAMKLNDKLLSFFVIEDHIRESAKDTLRFFKENGVTVKVISGDNPLTVSKIAELCGVENSDKYISLEGVPLEEIPAICEKYTIFARVSPEQKEALVSALQANKHKVAMTGDGVNDILALRKSNASISFAKATEAAKSCADVVLLDNDFSHLKEVVGEGRRVINNAQRTAVLFLMKAIAIIIMAFASIGFAKGQMWYSIENAYMLEATAIGTGGFLLSLDLANKHPLRGSFIKNISLKALSAGLLAAIAIILPITFFTIPTSLGYAPLISEPNVRSMITVLLTCAGLVVLLSLCIPFNGWRARAFVLTVLVAFALAMMLPTSYIGGRPTSAEMFQYDKAANQTIFDSQFMQEFLKPWRSDVFHNLNQNVTNYVILGVFFLVAFPIFFQNLRWIEVFIQHEYDKTETKLAIEARRREMREKREAFLNRRKAFFDQLAEKRKNKNE